MKKIVNMSLLLLLVVGGFCSSPSASAFGRGSTGVMAEYTVPVSEGLQAYSIFEITNLKSFKKDGVWYVSYELPSELLGYKQSVRYMQNNIAAMDSLISQDTVMLRGDRGVLNCQTKMDQLSNCSAKYDSRGIQVNLSRVEKIWKEKNVSAEELSGRMAVVESFSGELIGTFTIPQAR